MPDGTANTSYIHSHVFRTAVNGTWGEPFSIDEAARRDFSLTQTLDTQWDARHLAIVAFVYNDQGVQQAVKAYVRKP